MVLAALTVCLFPGLGVLTPQRAAPRTAWSVEARTGRRFWKQTRMLLGRVPLWPLPRRKVLAWRVAQEVGAGDTGFRLGRGLGQGHRPHTACAWLGAAAGLLPADFICTGFQAVFLKVAAFLCPQMR